MNSLPEPAYESCNESLFVCSPMPLPSPPPPQKVDDTERHLKHFFSRHGSLIRLGFYALLALLFFIYFVVVLSLDFERASGFFTLTLVAVSFALVWFVMHRFGATIHKHTTGPMVSYCRARWRIFNWYVTVNYRIILKSEMSLRRCYGIKNTIPSN